jgi:hypothetical protein
MLNIDKDQFISVCKNSLTMAKAAQKLGLHYNTFKRYALKFNCWCPNQGSKGIKKNSQNKKTINLSEILNGQHPYYQTYKLSRRLLSEHIKEHKCEICGLTHWNEKPIPLELHHIDGNRFNHKLENIILVCPNCHAQTNTYRGKNVKK